MHLPISWLQEKAEMASSQTGAHSAAKMSSRRSSARTSSRSGRNQKLISSAPQVSPQQSASGLEKDNKGITISSYLISHSPVASLSVQQLPDGHLFETNGAMTYRKMIWISIRIKYWTECRDEISSIAEMHPRGSCSFSRSQSKLV